MVAEASHQFDLQPSETEVRLDQGKALRVKPDNRMMFTSRNYIKPVRSYVLKQDFITPHCPRQNGMVEGVIRKLKEECVHRHRCESSRVIANLIICS